MVGPVYPAQHSSKVPIRLRKAIAGNSQQISNKKMLFFSYRSVARNCKTVPYSGVLPKKEYTRLHKFFS